MKDPAMLCLGRPLRTETFRLSETWVEEFTLVGPKLADDPLSLVDVTITAKLLKRYRPDEVVLEFVAGETGPFIVGDRTNDDTIPLVLSVPAATVAAELRADDYRLDLYAEAGGQISRFATGVRMFRE